MGHREAQQQALSLETMSLNDTKNSIKLSDMFGYNPIANFPAKLTQETIPENGSCLEFVRGVINANDKDCAAV
jgi:hypothetical protein